MTTVSALPYTLFTLPVGAIADMVDRKKILLAIQLWRASIAIAVAVLWMAHHFNPYLILANAFLFSAGFAVGSPAHSSVIAEMVSTEELNPVSLQELRTKKAKSRQAALNDKSRIYLSPAGMVARS